MLEGKLGEVVRLVIREVRRVLMIARLLLQVEEERKERVRMGWYLALSQGTILALIFLLIRRNNVLSN